MRCNIYKDQMESAELFGKPVLYTSLQIDRESIPENWHRYDLAATDRNPVKPATLEDHAVWNRVGTVLSPVPLKRETTLARQIKNSFHLHEELLDLAGFCEKNHLDCPTDPRKYVLRPASPGKEAGLFYSLMDLEQDAAAGTIGHMRFDFGEGRFRHSWWPHNDDQFNTPKFKEVLQEFVNELLARGPLKNESTIRRWCYGHPEGEIGRDSVGFVAETADYRFCLRCTTDTSDYGYLYCYDLNQQKLAMEQEQAPQQHGFSAEGLQRLQNAADPNLPHMYDWYLLQDCNTSAEEMYSGLSLEDAIDRYASSESGDKHLGVTKDGIAAVDLLIIHGGQEWYSKDYQRSDSFKDDPVIAEAVGQIRRTLDEPEQAAYPQTHPRIFAPIWVSIGEMGEYGSPECLYDRSAPFEQNIRSALQKFHSEPSASIELMKYFSWPSDLEMDYAIRRKIQAAHLSICTVGETAYAVVDLETTAELTDDEWDVFTRQLEYQYQDGWGAEFEATDIPIGQNKMILARLGCEELIFCYTEEQLGERQNPSWQTEQTM